MTNFLLKIRMPDWRLFIKALVLLLPLQLLASKEDTSYLRLKRMSLEELMEIEVSAVSKSPEKLREVASAVQAVTNEDIRRSSAVRLPEALRLAPNLMVGQVNSHDWAITARGFQGAPASNGALANKLLVMIDGRTVYTPLFGGVYWDAQRVLLEDVDQIEVVSGPGGTLWGANAVNGVINVISKDVKNTQGAYVSGGVGSHIRDFAAARYGGQAGRNVYYRFYGQFWDVGSTRLNDTSARDNYNTIHGGFRVDYYPSGKDMITVQGDMYRAIENTPVAIRINGQNLLSRWTHTFSPASEFKFQFYFDRTFRYFPQDGYRSELKTYDFDLQHNFELLKWNRVSYGAGYRLMNDSSVNTPAIQFTSTKRNLYLFNGFIQDQLLFFNNKLIITGGSKFIYNNYTGFEYQPSGRIAYTPTKNHTLWGAVTRAVRTPARFDAELVTPFLRGVDSFKSEKVTSFELGYRIRPFDRMYISVSGYYNLYRDLRSVNFHASDSLEPQVFVFQNDQKARSWGVEAFINYAVFDIWRLRLGYIYYENRITSMNALVSPASAPIESMDPRHTFTFQSILDVYKGIQLDLTGRFVDSLVTDIEPKVPRYFTMDARVAWQYKWLELSVVVRNIVQPLHKEIGTHSIPRELYGRVTIRL